MTIPTATALNFCQLYYQPLPSSYLFTFAKNAVSVWFLELELPGMLFLFLHSLSKIPSFLAWKVT